jgi:glycosyltransferase involved in cell wall biosynthesis
VASICLLPRTTSTGGVAAFQDKFTAGLAQHGITVSERVDEADVSAVLVAGGTRHLGALLQARRRGLRVVQRLDGINWLHRRVHTGLRHFLRAEYGNQLLALIRSHYATQIIYQSEFSRRWWQERFGTDRTSSTVVHNGVDLTVYAPEGAQERPANCCRVLLVEGRLEGGYETGVQTAFRLADLLAADLPIELMIAGLAAPALQSILFTPGRVPVRWAGLVPRQRIPFLDRSAHLLFSADINPACPNSVIEALACGLPVAAFETGALSELIAGDAGRLVPYGGNPWRLDPPDLGALARGAVEILQDQERFRTAARERAVQAFSLQRMVDGYLEVLLG